MHYILNKQIESMTSIGNLNLVAFYRSHLKIKAIKKIIHTKLINY